jgi:hypothetical protein
MIISRPVEIFQLHFKPVDFFSENPSIDVPSNRNIASTLVKEAGQEEAGGSCCSEKTPSKL